MADVKYSLSVKHKLWNAISEIASDLNSYVKHPGKDFSRKRRLDFRRLVRFLISMEASSQKQELLSFFHYNDPPSASALNQQRKKLNDPAMQAVFYSFNKSVPFSKCYKGFHLLACDGSDLSITRNPDDTDTAFCSGTVGHSCLGYNMIHLNALYDINERRYFDAIIQPGRKKNEFRAICDMIDRCPDDFATSSIFIADRGFCSYNVFAHAIEKGTYFLIRAKDHDRKGMIKNLSLPDTTEFDVSVEMTFIRRNTKSLRSLPGNIRFIGKDVDFDFLEYGSNDTYTMKLRIVRVKISENSYECIVTNLPSDKFTKNEIKHLYHLRWGIETSFRELKYAIWLKYFHSKKREFIEQEVWARLILYNFCEIITTHVVAEQNPDRKHTYQLNFTMAIHICHEFLRWKDGVAPPDVESLIGNYLLPVRPERSYTRKVKFQMPSSFLYR